MSSLSVKFRNIRHAIVQAEEGRCPSQLLDEGQIRSEEECIVIFANQSLSTDALAVLARSPVEYRGFYLVVKDLVM